VKSTCAVSTFFVYGATNIGLPPQVLCFGTLIFPVGLIVALANVALNRHHLARVATQDSPTPAQPWLVLAN
jgi:hypothetical protein